jgi:hypothetical protein
VSCAGHLSVDADRHIPEIAYARRRALQEEFRKVV